MQEKQWIWQDDKYPDFKFDRNALSILLCKVSREDGKLEGILDSFHQKELESLLLESTAQEIVESSQIEGEILQKESVRSSILKRLQTLDDPQDHSTDKSDGLVEMFMDSSTNHNILTNERLFGWHNTLFPSGYSGLHKINVASYRKEDISVVSQKNGREKIHYTAPPPHVLLNEMNRFLEYVNNAQENPYIKAAVVHLWFLTIHPFDDGNGRIARAITNYILSKELAYKQNYYSISNAIAKDKNSYYDILEHTQKLLYNKELTINSWIEWHTNMIKYAIESSLKQVKTVLQKSLFWERAREYSLNQREIKILNKLLDAGENGFEGGLNSKKYLSITKTSLATAKRDIKDLLEKDLIEKIEGSSGRNTRYKLQLKG
jgi:Fic family protein